MEMISRLKRWFRRQPPPQIEQRGFNVYLLTMNMWWVREVQASYVTLKWCDEHIGQYNGIMWDYDQVGNPTNFRFFHFHHAVLFWLRWKL